MITKLLPAHGLVALPSSEAPIQGYDLKSTPTQLHTTGQGASMVHDTDLLQTRQLRLTLACADHQRVADTKDYQCDYDYQCERLPGACSNSTTTGCRMTLKAHLVHASPLHIGGSTSPYGHPVTPHTCHKISTVHNTARLLHTRTQEQDARTRARTRTHARTADACTNMYKGHHRQLA